MLEQQQQPNCQLLLAVTDVHVHELEGGNAQQQHQQQQSQRRKATTPTDCPPTLSAGKLTAPWRMQKKSMGIGNPPWPVLLVVFVVPALMMSYRASPPSSLPAPPPFLPPFPNQNFKQSGHIWMTGNTAAGMDGWADEGEMHFQGKEPFTAMAQDPPPPPFPGTLE
jgi:hypothetical protein